jgi:uncharacterized membrane protein YeiB
MVHIAATWNPYTTTQTNALAYVVSGLGGLAAPLFVTVFGWGAALRPLSMGQRAVRATVLLLLQLVVNLCAPHLFEPFTPGVLSLFALLVLTQPWWLAVVRRGTISTGTAMALLVLATLLATGWTSGLTWSDRMAVDGVSTWVMHALFTGTYPLLSWLFFAMAGAWVQNARELEQRRSFAIVAWGGSTISGLLLVRSLQTGVPWALPSGEAYLTFFPANAPFLIAALAGVSILWWSTLTWSHRVAVLAPVGRMSLTVYVGHFLPLFWVHRWDESGGWSLNTAMVAVLIYTFVWGEMARRWFNSRPHWTLERAMRNIERRFARD